MHWSTPNAIPNTHFTRNTHQKKNHFTQFPFLSLEFSSHPLHNYSTSLSPINGSSEKKCWGWYIRPPPSPQNIPPWQKKILFSTWQKKTYSFFLSPSTSNASSPTFVNFCNFFVNFSVNFFLHLHRYNDSGSVFIFPKCCYSLWWLLQLKNSFFFYV